MSLPEIDDGLSDTISVTFPMGNRVESQVQVRGRVYMCSKLFLNYCIHNRYIPMGTSLLMDLMTIIPIPLAKQTKVWWLHSSVTLIYQMELAESSTKSIQMLLQQGHCLKSIN